jgi:perosamine synthetase
MIPVNEPLLNGNEAKYLAECLDTGWISSEGPFVSRFERGMADVAGQQHGIAVTNGSAALDVAVAALGLGPGDEVILPTFTIISCAASIVRAGAPPVVVDCEPCTWNLDPHQIESVITPRTKALMAVHIYGLPVDMDPVMDLAKRYHLKVIEDSAEPIGQAYRGDRGNRDRSARLVTSRHSVFTLISMSPPAKGAWSSPATRDWRTDAAPCAICASGNSAASSMKP